VATGELEIWAINQKLGVENHSSDKYFNLMLTETSSTRTSRHESSELLIVKRTVIIVHIQSAAAAAILDSVSFIARSSVDAPSCSLLCGRHQLSVRLLWLIIYLRVSSKEYEKYWENLYC